MAHQLHPYITQVATYKSKHPDPPKRGGHGGTGTTKGGFEQRLAHAPPTGYYCLLLIIDVLGKDAPQQRIILPLLKVISADSPLVHGKSLLTAESL